MPEKFIHSRMVDLSDEDVTWDLSEGETYGSYLRLDKLLTAQKPKSDSHDEMLFIIIHQASELWMKLAIHELYGIIDCLRRDDLDPAFKMLSRVARIQEQLIKSWDILATMTPSEYMTFRHVLESGSGFQSFQYRKIEFLTGNKNARLIEVHKHLPAIYEDLKETLEAPSLYDECIALLGRRGFDIPDRYLERDWAQPYEPHDAIEAAWLKVYKDPKTYWDLYELAEKLVDYENRFQQWRFSHMKTVERIIGYKRGTGGTAGVSYLVKALDLTFFPELYSLRTEL